MLFAKRCIADHKVEAVVVLVSVQGVQNEGPPFASFAL